MIATNFKPFSTSKLSRDWGRGGHFIDDFPIIVKSAARALMTAP